jgi:4-amino-4-deoxy-L-arabinose transferase-like glycosyltransferase
LRIWRHIRTLDWHTFLSHPNFISGKTPYQNFSYAYPPLFLYLLAPFASNSLPSWTLALPFVVLDAASVIPVYLIARKLTGHREALIASITFAIAPINLWYNDFLWLNPPPMTFFILLATYAFLSERYTSSFACLAVATLFKQIALSLFPVFFTTLLIKSVRKEVIRDSLLYGAICFLGSLPYIVTIPRIYLSSLGLPGIAPEWPMSTYQFSSPTSLAIAFGASFYEPAKFLLGVALLISFEILCFRIYKGRSTSDISFLTSITYALLLFHALFPRGIYKYYCARDNALQPNICQKQEDSPSIPRVEPAPAGDSTSLHPMAPAHPPDPTLHMGGKMFTHAGYAHRPTLNHSQPQQRTARWREPHQPT